MTIPPELKYTKDHEWIDQSAGPTARVGITEYAATAFGDVVFVDLPEIGAQVRGGEACGEVESTKSVSSVFSPVTGTVCAINEAIVDAPELINTDPYGAGWLFQVEVSDAGAADLLDAAAYADLTAKEH
jgi:glycine cleavage system H protein